MWEREESRMVTALLVGRRQARPGLSQLYSRLCREWIAVCSVIVAVCCVLV